MRFAPALFAIAFLIIGSGQSFAQAVRGVDFHPLERPKPICSIKGNQIRETLQVVISALLGAGWWLLRATRYHTAGRAALVKHRWYGQTGIGLPKNVCI